MFFPFSFRRVPAKAPDVNETLHQLGQPSPPG